MNDCRVLRKNREAGASLIVVVLAVSVFIGGLLASLTSNVLTFHRASAESFDVETAYRISESGVSYYLLQLAGDPEFFNANPAPQPAIPMDGGTFELTSAEPVGSGERWQIVVNGSAGRAEYPTAAVIGFERISVPSGLTLMGSGDPDDVKLRIVGGSIIASYDPEDGPFDPSNPDPNAGVWMDGSAEISGAGRVFGDLSLTGTLKKGSGTEVLGTLEEGAPPPLLEEDLTPEADSWVASSRQANNNNVLASVFGSDWTPVPGEENYGDLTVSSGTFRVPAGTYRFRKFEVQGNAKVIFDTSGGPTTIIYMGDDTAKAQSGRTLDVKGAQVQVDPGDTYNGLLTVLGRDTSLSLGSGAKFGQAPVDPDTTRYSTIVAADGQGDIGLSSSRMFANLFAPRHSLNMGGNSTWFGGAVVESLTIAGSISSPSAFAVDESVARIGVSSQTEIGMYGRWRPPHE